jgi:hypothetical protein
MRTARSAARRGPARSIGRATIASAAWIIALAACSLGNQEGPLVTCAELECGRINACAEGIIAQCLDGVTVRYHVCSGEDVCVSSWQIPGQYRCSFETTDCEGCRPERTGCEGGGGSAEGGGPPAGQGGSGDGGSDGGSPAEGGGGANTGGGTGGSGGG